MQAALTVGLLLASVSFPPVMIGTAALGATGIGKSQELIIAVDGERTHDVIEFDAALGQAKVKWSTLLWSAAASAGS
ncbi:MAG: hypothetical protein C5B58_06650 [Acidobacteria bacterium]|nr:MAG: hypothetical protein C5B58_06650 [Acidobacteriota bacterium]